MRLLKNRRRIGEQRLSPEIESLRASIESPCDPSDYKVLHRLIENPENYLVVSFGGGGVPALAGNAAFAGILDELGVKPHVREIWGTSAGAIVGAGWADGRNKDQMLEILQNLNFPGSADFSRWETFVKGFFRYMRKGSLPEGFVTGRHFREGMEKGIKARTFEELLLPFRALACTDDASARKVIFRKGPLIDAIMASMCLPGIMHPVKDWTGECEGYMDGGVAEKTPLLSVIEEHSRQMRSSNLLIICTHFTFEHSGPVRGFLMRFLNSYMHLMEEVWEFHLAKASANPKCKIVLLDPRLEKKGEFNFSVILEQYLQARREYKIQLSNSRLPVRFNAR